MFSFYPSRPSFEEDENGCNNFFDFTKRQYNGQYKQMEKLRKWAVIFSQNSHPNMHRYLDDNTNLL